jgi:uncharacterized SAM-binding protein YcdF (DUF218 family)
LIIIRPIAEIKTNNDFANLRFEAVIRRILKYLLLFCGCVFFILFIFCMTTAPFWTWYRLSTKYAGIHRPPEVIVVLGGGGMPSESGLMRTWYTARIGNHFQKSKIIIALPGDTLDPLSSVCQMKAELVLRGISGKRISFESLGTNTRAQAINIFRSSIKGQVSSAKSQLNILIITSPEHLYRAVRSFRKAGFMKVDGVPAFETAIEYVLSFDDSILGGNKWMPSIGKNLGLRYEFWTQLHYEQLIIREWLAIGYYKIKGWI